MGFTSTANGRAVDPHGASWGFHTQASGSLRPGLGKGLGRRPEWRTPEPDRAISRASVDPRCWGHKFIGERVLCRVADSGVNVLFIGWLAKFSLTAFFIGREVISES